MKAVKRTVFEVFVLGVAGVVVGFGYNAVRAKGSIGPQKNYFAAALAGSGGGLSESTGGHASHPYYQIDFADVVECHNDPDTEMGLNVFVDARNPELFAEGHIPGAIRCDPYEVEACIDDVMEVAVAADRIIVYCGGGECEDSVFMCREIVAAGIEFDAVYLYAGGWDEWTERGQPVEMAEGE